MLGCGSGELWPVRAAEPHLDLPLGGERQNCWQQRRWGLCAARSRVWAAAQVDAVAARALPIQTVVALRHRPPSPVPVRCNVSGRYDYFSQHYLLILQVLCTQTIRLLDLIYGFVCSSDPFYL